MVQQKSTQHCKAIILQLNFFLIKLKKNYIQISGSCGKSTSYNMHDFGQVLILSKETEGGDNAQCED